MKKFLAGQLLIIILFSLSSCRCLRNEEDCQNKGKVTIIGKINNNNDFKPINNQTGIAGEATKTLSQAGDFIDFIIGEPFSMTLNNIDPENLDLQYCIDFSTMKGHIEVVEKSPERTVVLENKCQIINIGPGSIPEIKVKDNLPRHQIIVTPRYANDCNFLGYEIRYGSIEEGCKQGRVNLKALRNCYPINKIINRNTTSSVDYWTQVLFGGKD